MTDSRVGDIDNDGKVEQSDLALLKRVLGDQGLLQQLGPEEIARLDVNGDGKLSYEDIIKLCQVMLADDKGVSKAVADKFAALRNKHQA